MNVISHSQMLDICLSDQIELKSGFLNFPITPETWALFFYPLLLT